MFLLLQSYTLTQKMCRLDQCRPELEKGKMQERLTGVFTTLKVAEWEHLLAKHPDRQYVAYLLNGIQEGFRIGSARKNMRAVVENPQDYLKMEQKRRVPLGPFERSEVLEVRTSHFGSHSQVEPARRMVADCRLVVEECQRWDQ